MSDSEARIRDIDRPSRPSNPPGMSPEELAGGESRPVLPPKRYEDLDGAEGRAIYFRPHRYQPPTSVPCAPWSLWLSTGVASTAR